MNYIAFGDIVEANGKTIRENNAAVPHRIAIGALVEFDIDDTTGERTWLKGRARMYIVAHRRDCDGTPLYAVAPRPVADHLVFESMVIHSCVNKIRGGMCEESFDVVDPNPTETVFP